MEKSQNSRTNVLIFLTITFWGIFRNEVTVFYIIYLFWFEELIKAVIDLGFIIRRDKKVIKPVLTALPVFFMMSIYWTFIVIIFGLMTLIGHKPIDENINTNLLIINIQTLSFKNLFFNVNIIAFAVHYLLYVSDTKKIPERLLPFNRRHIILHISIILGAFIQFTKLSELNIPFSLLSILTILPFLILKILLDKTFEKTIS